MSFQIGPFARRCWAAILAVSLAAAAAVWWSGDRAPGNDGGSASEEHDRPAVVIYHTHTSENYAPNPTHAEPGSAGDIVAVGVELAAQLDRRGIRSIHVPTVHDQEWSRAYEASRQSIAETFARVESVAALLDIHRDAIEELDPGLSTQPAESGQGAARILLVIGSLENPQAQANVAFAEALRDALERRHPGVARGIRIIARGANGDMHPRSVQAYIGDYRSSSLEEAKASAAMLADALAEVLGVR